MRLISTRLHAFLDYGLALFSIALPALLDLEGQRETSVLLCFGLMIILYSLFTEYELGMSKHIPIWLHMRIDQVLGLTMMATPWLLKFSHAVIMPQVLMGSALIVNSLIATDEVHNIIHFIRQRPWEKWFRMSSNH